MGRNGIDHRAYCYDTLDRVSRSFAVVIRQLPPTTRDAVCTFYLVLRALDTIEDDPALSPAEKRGLMDDLTDHLGDEAWTVDDVGERAQDVELMRGIHRIMALFNDLHRTEQQVIHRQTVRMKEGMLEFADRPVNSLADYDRYCYYVAGIVGEGLSDLFMARGREVDLDADDHALSVAMGLFLQKTNITRDVHEDVPSGRIFWPRAIWSRWVQDASDLVDPAQERPALSALNAMVANAVTHLADCMAYLQRVRQDEVLRFCAIPQIMAIGTLASVYDNPATFRDSVKLPRLLTMRILHDVTDLASVQHWMLRFADQLDRHVHPTDEASDAIRDSLNRLRTSLA